MITIKLKRPCADGRTPGMVTPNPSDYIPSWAPGVEEAVFELEGARPRDSLKIWAEMIVGYKYRGLMEADETENLNW
ncbi:MAG: hypothetical protein KKB59_10645 [Spirochaetes bacterium]|nr:hypothetical protein [Spirochaetota bacterium]